MKKSEIEIIKDVLIEAQEKIEKHLNIDSQSSDYGENVEQDPRFAAFYEIESGLYDIIQALKAQHIA